MKNKVNASNAVREKRKKNGNAKFPNGKYFVSNAGRKMEFLNINNNGLSKNLYSQ